MYVCICKGVTESDVRKLGQHGIVCPQAIASSLGLTDRKNCCGRCLKKLDEFVALATGEQHAVGCR
ncbi:MAG: (2Fe-2S)-binding protein [Nitrospirae bacterium]|nr:MAG: (2Fe-2S)-binding protein [Nitrospirota bacterium]